MKTIFRIIALIILASQLTIAKYVAKDAAKGLVVDLIPDKEAEPKHKNGDYGAQIIEQFEKLLQKKGNEALKREFEAFEDKAVGKKGVDRSGKYMGIRTNSFVLHQSENVNFYGKVGDTAKREYTQTVVVYYSYHEGFRRGMEATKGVFATFEVRGNVSYEIQENDSSKLLEHKVTATFQGFSKTLLAEKPEVPPAEGE